MSQDSKKTKYSVGVELYDLCGKLREIKNVELQINYDVPDNPSLLEKIFQNKVADDHRFDYENSRLQCLPKDNKIDLNNLNDLNLKNKSIVIILESPHKDEFCYCCHVNKENECCVAEMYPIRPANGKTGKKLDKYLEGILRQYKKELENKEKDFHVFIVNPIQYQTSLWALHQKPIQDDYKKLRNEVWESLWNHAIEDNSDNKDNLNNYVFRNDFYYRLKKYDPAHIINCCTKPLNDLIDSFLLEFLKEEFKDVNLYKGYHPSAYSFNENNRKLKKIDVQKEQEAIAQCSNLICND